MASLSKSKDEVDEEEDNVFRIFKPKANSNGAKIMNTLTKLNIAIESKKHFAVGNLDEHLFETCAMTGTLTTTILFSSKTTSNFHLVVLSSIMPSIDVNHFAQLTVCF